jgi:tetratricopeptide (TPR) repeat protein
MTLNIQEQENTQESAKKNSKLYLNTVKQFKKITFFYGLFKLGFFFLLAFEGFLALMLFPIPSVFAIVLGSIFLTLFTYFVLIFYFQTKKPEQLKSLQERFLFSCRQSIAIPEKTAEHHLTIAQAALKLSYHLYELELRYFTLPQFLNFFGPIVEKISFLLFHEDTFKMKEELILAAIEEHLKQIRVTPTDLEIHASLASSYIHLAKLYREVKEEPNYARFSKKTGALLLKKFSIASERAIEELKILQDFAPNDPWVHAQLAQCYQALDKKEEEASEYEKILELSPQDNAILFRLGVLYFELGRNAKALEIYDKLRISPYKNAQELLSHYGVVRDRAILEENW